MPRFKLTIEYAGTRYSGWQIQDNAKTIQGEIARAVRTVTGRKDFELYGSGRTDAGVHALAQVAHLDVSTSLPPETLSRRVNDELPSDINILSAVVTRRRFHARHDALSRCYLYQISRRRTAFGKAYVWWVKEPLDIRRMQRAAKAFVGMRDFKAFTPGLTQDDDDASIATDAASPSSRSTRVLVDRLDLVEDGDLILVEIEGSHFLWKMVRRVVGVLVEIGRGGLEPEAVERLLTADSTIPARLTAPPSGLFLERVRYADDVPALQAPAVRPVMTLSRFERG
jgi:tRNA pseudouridine38-40 synthase